MKYIIDGHYDILMDVAARRKKGERQVIRRRYYPAFQKGGVTGIVASIFVDSQYLPYGALSVAMEQISALHCEIEETPDLLMLCTSADDFLRAAETGKIGFLLSFEGAEPVSSCLLLHGFYAAGVRGLGLAWSRRNAAADGCDFSGSLKKGGLTEFGRELVKEDVDLDALMAGSEDEENQKLADTEKANPFSYNAETNNLVDVLSAYMYANYYSEDFVVTVDEANKTFIADREESDYLAAAHYDGTYEITEDGFVNATWKEPDYDYDMSCVGSEYAAQWDKFTLKEDLSNLDDVLYSVMNEYSWDHDYPRESLTRTETSELEGTAVLKDGDAERSAVYKIYAGVDPLVKVTIHENDSDVNYTNYYFRE